MHIWYNIFIKSSKDFQANGAEMVTTISRAEYEKFQALSLNSRSLFSWK